MLGPSLSAPLPAVCDGRYVPVPFDDLPGWNEDDFQDAASAFCHSATFFDEGAVSWATTRRFDEATLSTWIKVSQVLQEAANRGPEAFRTALTQTLTPYALQGEGGRPSGTLTGYYHPLLRARHTRGGPFQTPLYRRPDDLLLVEDAGAFRPDWEGLRIGARLSDKTLRPYHTRQEIMDGALSGKNLEIAWVADGVEAFFMMVQGSGTLLYDNGEVQTLDYAATNGHPYASLGRVLIARGQLKPQTATAQKVKDWLYTHPDEAPALMAHNPSYVFFKEAPSPFTPCGALATPLTAMRSLACDPRFVPLGAPVWVSAPSVPWDTRPLARLFFAQDVGGAIKGEVRADLYCGHGEEGFAKASALNHPGALYVLWPKELGTPHVR